MHTIELQPPVIEFHPNSEPAEVPRQKLMQIIVALIDFSDVTARVLEQAAKLARAFQGRLVLLHAVPDQPAVVELGLASPTVLQHPSEKKIEADYNSLLNLRDSLAESGIPVSVQQLEQSSAEKVLEQCQVLEADVIVMGSHHHGAFYQLLVGTFTSDVLKRATCPVLVVPPPVPMLADLRVKN